MRPALCLACLMTIAGSADAALVERHSGQPFRFWVTDGYLPGGTINATARNSQVIVRGRNNLARNSVGLIHRAALLRGLTTLNASATGTTAVATGSGNVATNDIGTIGNE